MSKDVSDEIMGAASHTKKALILEAKDIAKIYYDAASTLTIFEGLNFELGEGESVGIVGSSGSGKTTLLNILGGLDSPTNGTISLCGIDFGSASDKKVTQLRNQYLGFVYQFHHLLAEFSAEENVAMPLIISGQKRAKALMAARAMLKRVGLEPRALHKPSELSGGERQRVAIARALVNQPRVVMMDEPTGNLDEHTARSIQEIMLDLQKDMGTSFIIVTHDIPLAKRMDRTLTLEDGRLVDLV
jgi:lipoprotein-releasing system ATP-binding protein